MDSPRSGVQIHPVLVVHERERQTQHLYLHRSLVGASMFKSVGQISFGKIEEGVPAFLTLILIPLTFSITQGILWGFISHTGLYLMVGRRKDIHPVTYVLAGVSI